MNIRLVVLSGIAVVIGIVMVIIGLGFIPEVVTQTTTVRSTSNFTDYIGLDPMAKVIPTFMLMGLVFGGTVLSFAGIGVVGYKGYKSMKG